MIDLYCERVGTGLFAEPLNAVSNLAFLIAAFISWQDVKQLQAPGGNLFLIPVLMAVTGLGSLLFHLLANPSSQVADLVALLLFQLAYLWLYLQRTELLNTTPRIIFITLFLLSVFYLSLFQQYMNGSLLFLPSLLVLLGLGIYHASTGRPGTRVIVLATLFFLTALIARTVDIAVCATWPVGTHFLWHILNAMVMVMMFRVLLIQKQQSDDTHKR